MAFVKHSTVLENTDGAWQGPVPRERGLRPCNCPWKEEMGLRSSVQTALWGKGGC